METKTRGSDSCSEASCTGKPNCPTIPAPGTREGLQARACIPGKQRAGPDRNPGKDRTRSDSPCVSGLHVTLGTGLLAPPLSPSHFSPLLPSVRSTRLPTSLPTQGPEPPPPPPSPPFFTQRCCLSPHPHLAGESGTPCSDSPCVHWVWPQRTPPFPSDTAQLPEAAEALEAGLPTGPRKDTVGKAGGGQRGKETGRVRGRPTRRRRTHPRPDVVQRFGAAAPAAQTPHPQHRPAPAWSSRRPCLELGRLRPSLPRARPRRGVLARGLL